MERGKGSRENIMKKSYYFMVFLWILGKITFNSSMLSLGMIIDLSLCFKLSSNNVSLSE